MITIDLQVDPPYETFVDQNRLTRVVESALETCQVVDAELTIVITTDEVVQEFNQQYRAVDAPTDVLSFPTSDGDTDDGFVMPDDLAIYLGDIIIAAPTATRQAESAGHTPAEEIYLLAIHGVLHLMGYDHDTSEAKHAMWQKQTRILQLNNLAHIKPTEEEH